MRTTPRFPLVFETFVSSIFSVNLSVILDEFEDVPFENLLLVQEKIVESSSILDT
jgi:hypothetical protein